MLGVASAVVYGAADFLGALATRRSGVFAVVVWSQFAGLTVLAIAIAVTGEALPAMSDMGWGAAGGVGGGVGVVLLYRGLAIGRMGVVAPTAAVGAASIPVVVGLLLGERPALVALAGVVVALTAIVLVASDSAAAGASGSRVPPGLPEAVGAAMGFAVFFICLANVQGEAALWPLLAARVSIGIAAMAGVATRSSLRPGVAALPGIAVVGVLDMAANLLYMLASRRGLLSIVAVLVSLYPAVTVLLARFVLDERLSARQMAGLLAAGVGVVLIAAV